MIAAPQKPTAGTGKDIPIQPPAMPLEMEATMLTGRWMAMVMTIIIIGTGVKCMRITLEGVKWTNIAHILRY